MSSNFKRIYVSLIFFVKISLRIQNMTEVLYVFRIQKIDILVFFLSYIQKIDAYVLINTFCFKSKT